MRDFLGRKSQLPLRKEPEKREDQLHQQETIFFFPLSKFQALLPVFSTFKPPPKEQSPPMEKHQYGFALSFSIVVSLGLASFVSCIAAELKRTKVVVNKVIGSHVMHLFKFFFFFFFYV